MSCIDCAYEVSGSDEIIHAECSLKEACMGLEHWTPKMCARVWDES